MDNGLIKVKRGFRKIRGRLNVKGYLICIILLVVSTVAEGFEASLNGFLQGNYSFNTASSSPDGGDLKWAEERIQLKLDISNEQLRLFSKTGLYYDNIDREVGVDFREIYLDYTGVSFDLRAGRQIITWGLGDLVFINDIFPKDYEAFFSGRPLEYLKLPVDALKMGLYPALFSIDIVIVPFFEPNNLPHRQRFWLYDPMENVSERKELKPSKSLKNTEIAMRFYRNLRGVDLAVYFYRGFYRMPSQEPTTPSGLKLFYPSLSVYGVSLQYSALNGVMSIEAGYYDSREDREGTDPFIPNSSLKFLIGYQRQLWEDFTVTLQYFGEYMKDYSEYLKTLPEGIPKMRRFTDLFSVRLTQLLMHQTLRLSYFSFWSISDGDYLLNPEIRYSFTDSVWASVGAMIFGGGESWSQFGSLDRNDNVYVQMRYEF